MRIRAATACFAGLLETTAVSLCVSDYEAIRQVLATYPLAIDNKDFGMLDQVFREDVVANYSAPLGVLNGLQQIEAVLEQAVALVTTQHAYSTQKIDIHDDEANVTTYYTASHFGRGESDGEVLYAYGKYLDQLARQITPQSGEHQWRIYKRHLVYMGPQIGNASIFSTPTP